MVEQARTREQTALGWLFWGVGGWGQGQGAGSLGASWARSSAAGAKRAELGLGLGLVPCLILDLGAQSASCGDYPDNGKVPVVPTAPASCMLYRRSSAVPIPIDDDT